MARAPSSSHDESNGLVARPRGGDNAEPLTITEISTALKRTVEDRFGYVRLRGELSGVMRARSGHMYCALKDEKSVIDGVMWKGNAGRLAFNPEDGLEVIASGKLTTYAGRSKYQIVIDSLEIAGEGALLALLEKTRARLEAEGLFASGRKRSLPYLPKTIGVVTSPTGSVIRDILHRLADRFPSHVLVWPVLVQGDGAAKQVEAAIRGFSALPQEGGAVPRPDLVIVARGGGSVEDLWSFNEEAVVRAIAECTIPVISAVGHETDTTLADYAADRRAPTPTAAAEMAVPVRADLAAFLGDLGTRQSRAIHRPIELGRERLEARVKRLPAIDQLLQSQSQRLDDLTERLRRGLTDRAAEGRTKLAGAAARLSPQLLQRRSGDAKNRLANARLVPELVRRPLAQKSEKLDALARLASQFHPEIPLKRGYAIVRDTDGNALTTRGAAAQHNALRLQFDDGKMDVSRGAELKRDNPETLRDEPAQKPKRAKPSPKKPKSSAKSQPHPAQEDLFG
jgi:exodeoxyribonuclease VII large subunit